jgi:hypothetical protein
MAMPVTDNRSRVIRHCRSRPASIAWPRQRRFQLVFNHCIDKAAYLRAQVRLDRIKPIVEKLLIGHIGQGFRGIYFHGVISIGGSTPIRFEKQTGDYVTFKFPPLPRRHLGDAHE